MLVHHTTEDSIRWKGRISGSAENVERQTPVGTQDMSHLPESEFRSTHLRLCLATAEKIATATRNNQNPSFTSFSKSFLNSLVFNGFGANLQRVTKSNVLYRFEGY